MRDAAGHPGRELGLAGTAGGGRSRLGRAIQTVAGGLSVFLGVWVGFLILLPAGQLLLAVSSAGPAVPLSAVLRTAVIDAISWVVMGAVAVAVSGWPRLVSERWSSTLLRALAVAALLIGVRLGTLYGLAGPMGWEFPASFPVMYLRFAPEHLLLMLAFFGTGYALAEARRSGAVELAGQRLRLQVARAEFQWQTLLLQPGLLLGRLKEIDDQLGSDPELARDSIRRLSSILRYDLHRAGRPVVAIAEEAGLIADHLAQEGGRDRDLQVKLDVHPGVEAGDIHAPPLVLFTLVTSVVEACRSASTVPDQVRLAARSDDHLLHIDLKLPGVRNAATLARASSIEVFRNGLQRRFGDRARLTFLDTPRALKVVLTLPATTPTEGPDEPVGHGRDAALEAWPMGLTRMRRCRTADSRIGSPGSVPPR
jgi:hypothetical protein